MSSIKKGLRRAGIVGLSTVVAGSMMTSVAIATPTFSFDRLQGIDRYATSVATATQYGPSTNVILASGVAGHYPDALTASYLAGIKHAPILLTKLAATPANVLARIATSGATDVWLIGGTGVISAAQEAALDVTYNVHRLGGLDRYLTAQLVINAGGTTAVPHTAILATGVNFPDAIAGGPLAYVKGFPLAITRTDSLPSSTLTALQTAGVTNVIILGGPTVVSVNVVNALTAAGITSTRKFGLDRAETSSILADYMITSQGFSNTGVNVASGYDLGTGADALGGAALSGKENRPTLITRSNTVVGGGLLAFMTAHASTLASGHIFGGLGAVNQSIEDQLTAAARTATSNQTYSVAPSGDAVVAIGATTRTYTATVPAGTVVDIALFQASNITVAGGVVTFADATGDNIADVGTLGGAIISSVNGVANAGPTFSDVTSTGTITFTVTDPGAAATVRPVVYAGVGNNVLDLIVPTPANNNPKQPSEAFSIGGTTIFNSAEAPLGTSTITVVTADTANDFYTNSATYFYDSNDVFQYSGIGITMAQFESILSTGDVITAVYQPDPANVSTFNLTTDALGTAGVPAVAVVNLDSGATINDVTATFTAAPNASSGTTYQLLDGAAVVAGTTQAAGSTAGTWVITALNVANGSHVYSIKATNPVSGVNTTTAPAGAVTVPGAADTTGPGSTFLAQTNGGLGLILDSGDTIKVVFNEPMAAPNAADKIRFADADGTIVDVTCGTNATCTRNAAAEVVNAVSRPANTVLTYVLTADPTVIVVGTTVGEQVASGVVTDQAGNTDTSGNAWDLGAISTDKTL